MVATRFGTQHISYHEDRADHGFAWDVRFNLSFNSSLFLTTVKVHLTGDNPGALKGVWDSAIGSVWNDRGFFSDGTWTYANRFDIQFVNSGADQNVTVTAGTGRSVMTHWYTIPQGWGSAYTGRMAAHEFGHMFGLFDEYAGGATYANQVYSNSIMSDFWLGGFQRDFWTIDYFAEAFSHSSLNLIMPKRFGSSSDSYTGTTHQDALLGFGGNDTLNGNAGGDWLDGGLGNDKLYGAAGSDQIFGGIGNDLLNGGSQDDRLFGQNGDDQLYGGLGHDYLSGGLGADRFIFSTAVTSANSDMIADFGSTDSIWLSGKIFTKLGTSVSASEFRVGTKALDSNDYLIFNPTNGRLYYDADGSKTKYAPVLIADLQSHAPLNYTKIKMFDAFESLDNLTISKSGGIEGFSHIYTANQDITYDWSFDAYTIPDTLRIWDNTGYYVNLLNKSGVWSGHFDLHTGSNGQVHIAVAGSASGTVWVLHVQRAAQIPQIPDFTMHSETDSAIAASRHTVHHTSSDMFIL